MSNKKEPSQTPITQRSSLTKSEEASLKQNVEKARQEIAKKPNRPMDFKECL